MFLSAYFINFFDSPLGEYFLRSRFVDESAARSAGPLIHPFSESGLAYKRLKG